MKKTKVWVGSLFILTLVFNTDSFAHSHERCTNLKNNSCWHARNESAEQVQIKCNDTFFRSDLGTGRSYSYQYDSGLGDGLGYPSSLFNCEFTVGDRTPIEMRFKTLNWGDRVQFRVTSSQVIITLREFWGRRVETIERNYFD